jgi:hypothetical protein
VPRILRVVGRKSIIGMVRRVSGIGVRVESLESTPRSAAKWPANAVFGRKFFPSLLCWTLLANFIFDTNALMAFMLLSNNSIGTAQ